jgi:lysophospholipase L1-like esterase
MKYSQNILAALTVSLALAGCHSSPTGPSPSPAITAVPDVPSTPVPVPSEPPPRTSRTRYLAFGDSITAGTTSPAVAAWRTFATGPPQSYPYKLQALLRGRYTAQAIEVYNEGKPGEPAEDGVLRFSPVLRSVAPDVVILLHGVNDISFLGMRGVRSAAGFVNTMASEARLAGVTVIICTIPRSRAGGFRSLDLAVVEAYNNALRDVARGERAILVDFDVNGLDLRFIGADGLHPTDEGYTRMAEILFSHARELFETGS